MLRAEYRIVKVDSSCVWIVDTGHHYGRSVTNDAERVVAALHEHFPAHRYVYRDSLGRWDELLHSGAAFIGFAPAEHLAL